MRPAGRGGPATSSNFLLLPDDGQHEALEIDAPDLFWPQLAAALSADCGAKNEACLPNHQPEAGVPWRPLRPTTRLAKNVGAQFPSHRQC